MKDYIQHSVEATNWGLNIMTFSFIACAFFTVLQGWGLHCQSRTIWNSKSTQSLSVPWFSYNGCYCLAFICYGYEGKSLTMMFSGAQGLLYLPILIGIQKYKGLSRQERLCLVLFSLLIPAMILTSRKDLLLTALMLPTLFMVATQPYILWKTKNAGAVDPKMIFSFLAASTFWTIYAICVKDWVIAIFNPIGTIIFTFTLVLWYKYRKTE